MGADPGRSVDRRPADRDRSRGSDPANPHDERALAGSILLWRDLDLPGPEVSYWLGRDFWGRGIATQALRHFLGEVRARPLFGRAAAENVGSIRVLEHAGFIRIGGDAGWSDALEAAVPEVILRLDD